MPAPALRPEFPADRGSYRQAGRAGKPESTVGEGLTRPDCTGTLMEKSRVPTPPPPGAFPHMCLRSPDSDRCSSSGPDCLTVSYPTARLARGMAGALILLLAGTPVQGQEQGREVVLRVEENFRTEPGGSLLAQLAPGTRLSVLQEQDGWTQAAMTGYVWVPSIQQRQTSTIHGLVVSAPGGENLREEPAGRISGRLLSGMVLEELGRATDWVEVRRVGWIWGGSVEAAGPPPSFPYIPKNIGRIRY